MSKKLSAFIKMLVGAIGLLGICVVFFGEAAKKNADEEGQTGVAYDFAMGTSISAQFYDYNGSQTYIREQVFNKIKALDEEVISWRAEAGELGILNSTYTADAVYIVSEELYTAISQSINICRDSNGALDITIRPLAAEWGIESQGEFSPPAHEDIENALNMVGFENIQMGQIKDDLSGEITISKESMIIDLGAVGKGYALDVVKEILTDNNVGGALITVGGSIMVYGSKEDGSNWRVGVRNPEKSIYSDDMLGYLEFSPDTVTCISTSGGYEKYKEYNGEKYHHILDRKTGYPAESDLISVTVVCNNGLVSDGLSTACYVLGYHKALTLLEKYNAEAVFVMEKGDIVVTEGLRDFWTVNK